MNINDFIVPGFIAYSYYRMIKLSRFTNGTEQIGKTEKELLEKIDLMQLRGMNIEEIISKENLDFAMQSPILLGLYSMPSWHKIIPNTLGYLYIGDNIPDFVIVNLEQPENGVHNLKIDVLYNGRWITDVSHTRETRESLSEAVHHLRTMYGVPIGFNG